MASLFCSPLCRATRIFGFSEFLVALTLLVVVYTIADVRYKFRIAVTPGALYLTTFLLIAAIGLQTLLTEVWIAEHWWVPRTAGLTYSIWQGIFGLLFLGTFLTWMYYAFIRPPIFSKQNALRYARALYACVLRGADDELKVIANELARSAESLIRNSKLLRNDLPGNETRRQVETKKKPGVEDYAHDVLLLIANRRLCRQIVASSPITAQVFFESMGKLSKYDIPIGSFARNISAEAIAQKGSFLYNESEGFSSGLLGYLKPVSKAIYGNFELVEAVGRQFRSPLDIEYDEYDKWDAMQWDAYGRVILLTLKDCLAKRLASGSTFTLNRAMGSIRSAFGDLYKLNNAPETYDTDTSARFSVAVRFAKDAIDLIDEEPNPPKPRPRVRERANREDIYDQLANLIFEMCLAAAGVKSPPDTSWSIHYVALWGTIFGGLNDGAAWRIVQHKVRRLLYNEIVRLGELPNYKGSRILGFCLNVLGMTPAKKPGNINRDSYALAKAVHSWTKKHYLWLREQNPDVADSVLIGSVSFDAANNRLVKTYFKGLNREAPKVFLDLEKSTPPARRK